MYVKFLFLKKIRKKDDEKMQLVVADLNMNILPWIAETDKIGQHKCKGHVMIG